MDEQQVQVMWQQLQTEERLSERAFIDCSNALLEWRVKNIRLPRDFEVVLRYKLGQFGMLKDFGEPIQKADESDWRIAVDHIDEVVKQIKLRKIEDMEDQFDNEFFLRLRLAHDKLHCMLDVPELQNIPVREIIYCLAVFLLMYKEERKYGMFKLLLLPVDVVEFLRTVVTSVMIAKSRTGKHAAAFSKVVKKRFQMLRKCCKQVEELYILDGTYNDLVTVCALENALVPKVMLSHITGKLDKLVSSRVRIMEGLNKLLKEMIEDYRYAIKSEKPLKHFLPLLKALLGLDLFLRIMVAYQKFSFRLGQCRTFKQMRLLSSYIYNIDHINDYHEMLYQNVTQFYLNIPSSDGYAKQHSDKMKTLDELKNWLISTTSVRLDQIVYFMEQNINLDRIKNLIHFDLSTISYRIKSKLIQTHWSNTDLEEHYLNSIEKPLASHDSVVPGDVNGDHKSINSPDDKSSELPRDASFNSNIWNDLLSLNENILQTSQQTTEATQIWKNGLFDEPISAIKLILVEQKCSTMHDISWNQHSLPHHARIQLQYWMTQILQLLKNSNRLVNEVQLLRAGHEMIYGQTFLEFLENDLPTYRAMVFDCDLSIVLSALLLTEVLHGDVFNGKPLSLDIRQLKDIQKSGLQWVQIEQELENNGEDVSEIKLALKSGRYDDAVLLSGKEIIFFAEEIFGWESLGCRLNHSDFGPLLEEQDIFLYVVEKLVTHANVQSLKCLLKSRPQYIPHDSLLIKSIQSGCEDLFHLLVSRKNCVEENVIKMAIAAHMHQIVMSDLHEHSDETLQNVLQAAVNANNVQLLKMVISRPFIDPLLSAVLPISVQFNRLTIVQSILNHYKTPHLNSLLFSAACHKHWAMCRLLAQRGANPHCRVDSSSQYVTSCQLAIVGNCTKIVKEWTKAGAKGNRDLGYLTLAASSGSVNMVKVLLRAGFSVIDEHQLYPMVWPNCRDVLQKVLIDCLKPDCWTTAVNEIGAWWYRLLEQLKLVPYLTCLTNCEELQQEDDFLLIVARRLKLYRMADAHWCIKSCEITHNGGRENCSLLDSYIQIQSLLKQNFLELRLFKRIIHVFSLTAMSYAFVEVKSFQEIMNEGLEIFVEEQVFTHSNVLDVIYNVVGKNVLLSCSIRIFNDESEPQRFELLYLEPFKCIVELQISRLQESCELLTIDALHQISQEHRLLLAVRSGDHTSFIFLMDQIEKVEHEDIWLNPALVHELIDCSHMSTKAKGLVLEKFHAIGIQFGLRHPETGQSAVAYALHKNQLELSDMMMSFICKNLTEPQQFIAIIQQCSVDVFKKFLSTRRHSDQEEFNLISNALRELTVKHVYVSAELQTFLWYKLAKYGFANLCTDSDTPKNPRSWMGYVNDIIENVKKLMCRSDRNDFLGIDNEALCIFRTIHKQLFFIKDKPHLKNIPLREATFLLAVFLSNFSSLEYYSKSLSVFRMVLNKISLMRSLEFIAEQLSQFRDFFLNIIESLVKIVPVSYTECNSEKLQTKWDRERKSYCFLPKLTNNIWNKLVSKKYSMLTPSNLVYTVLSTEPVIFTPNLTKLDSRCRKKFLKLFHRVKQLYSLRKVLNILKQMSLDEPSKAVTVASMKRFLQIFGECIKNTPNSPNLPSKLNRILQQQLTGYISFVKQTRDVTCHNYPLAKKLLSLDDQFVYYSSAGNYLRMVKVTIAVLVICTSLEYMRSLVGSLRQCRSLDRMRSLIRFVGIQDFVDSDQNDCMNIIIRYRNDLNAELKAIPIKASGDKETLERLILNHDRRLHVVKILQDEIQRFLYKFHDIQIAAFSTTSVQIIHKFLDINLLSTNNHDVLDLIEKNWVVLPNELDKLSSDNNLIERSAAKLTTLQINFDINQEILQTFHCREEVRKIVEELFEGTHVEAHEKQQFESELLSRLESGGRGYFNNIFMVDSKIQAIKTVFRQQSVKHFTQKLETIRARDVVELQIIFETKQQFIRDVLQKYSCSSIELLIQNAAKIPQQATLAIEYWLMELCEILISTKQFRDNFFALKYDLQMICGRNFRNYLAHDALSYNLLTCGTHARILINALVMVQKQWNLFGGILFSSESNIMDTYTDEPKWLNEQKSLVQSALDFRHEDAKRIIHEGALITGKFWTVKDVFEGLSPVALAEMSQYTKSNEFRSLGANIRKTLAVVGPFVQWDTFSSPAWNMKTALHSGNFDLAASYLGNHSWGQWVKSRWFPQSIYPCLGALLNYLNSLDQHEEMLNILMCFGPDFMRTWICVASEKFTDFLLMKLKPPALTEILFHVILLHKSFDFLKHLTSYVLFKSSALSAAVLGSHVQYFDYFIKEYCSTENTDVNTTFEFCARYGRIKMLRIMSSSFEITQSALNSALNVSTQYQQWETVHYLLNKGAHPWIRLKTNEPCAGEIAIKCGNLRLTKKFLKLVPPSYSKHRLLPMAARYGSVRMVKHLERLGCKIWKDREVLLQSMKNHKHLAMARFIESSILDFPIPVPYADTVSLNGSIYFYADYFANGTCNKQLFKYNKLHKWLQILHEHKVFNFFTELPASNVGGFIELLQFDCPIAKRILKKMMDFGRIDGEYYLQSIAFFDEGLETDEIIFKLERKISSIIPTNIHDSKEIVFQYKIETTTYYLNVLIDLFNTTRYLPDVLQSTRTHRSHPTPSEFCSDLIQTLDNHTESSALIANFELEAQAFYLIRVGSSSAIAEIMKAKCSSFLFRLLNSTNSDGETVLHNVPSDSDIELLDLLIANGVNVSAVDRKGQTALVLMITRQFQWDILKHLLQHCALNDIRNNKGLHIFHLQDHEGQTLLHRAVNFGRLQVVEFLLNHGADQTVPDNSGMCPIHNAVLWRHTATVYELIKNRADVINLPHLTTGDTPFFLAAQLNIVELVEMFLNNGADLGTRNKHGFTVVAITIIKECCAALKVILDFASLRGIDVVNNTTPKQWNALRCTLKKDNVEIFRIVLEHMVGQSIDSNMTEESLIRMKQILLTKYTFNEERDVEAAISYNNDNIRSYLRECETIYDLEFPDFFRNNEGGWFSVEGDVFEVAICYVHVNIRSYLRECEAIYNLKMNDSLRNNEGSWFLDYLELKNDI